MKKKFSLVYVPSVLTVLCYKEYDPGTSKQNMCTRLQFSRWETSRILNWIKMILTSFDLGTLHFWAQMGHRKEA